MATITIRNLSDRTYAALQARATNNDRSVEAEVRDVLDKTVEADQPNILLQVRENFADSPADLTLPPRTAPPRPTDLS